jgi:hypothetical protein
MKVIFDTLIMAAWQDEDYVLFVFPRWTRLMSSGCYWPIVELPKTTKTYLLHDLEILVCSALAMLVTMG